VFSEESRPVTCVTTFKTTEESIAIANDTMSWVRSRLWSRDAHVGIKYLEQSKQVGLGQVAITTYPAHAPLEDIRSLDLVERNHLMMLGHYRQPNMAISYSKQKLGFSNCPSKQTEKAGSFSAFSLILHKLK